MAAVSPHVIWKGKSFDWYAGSYFEKFLKIILDNAEKQATLSIENVEQGQLTNQDFIRETGIDDINDISSSESSSREPNSYSSDKVKLFRQIFADHFHELTDIPVRTAVVENVDRTVV